MKTPDIRLLALLCLLLLPGISAAADSVPPEIQLRCYFNVPACFARKQVFADNSNEQVHL